MYRHASKHYETQFVRETLKQFVFLPGMIEIQFFSSPGLWSSAGHDTLLHSIINIHSLHVKIQFRAENNVLCAHSQQYEEFTADTSLYTASWSLTQHHDQHGNDYGCV